MFGQRVKRLLTYDVGCSKFLLRTGSVPFIFPSGVWTPSIGLLERWTTTLSGEFRMSGRGWLALKTINQNLLQARS